MTVIVQPGDTLIVCCVDPMNDQQAAAVRAALTDRLPELADVIVLSAVTCVAAYRPQERLDLDLVPVDVLP